MADPIIPWMGGKRRLAEVLLARFPPHSCYVEPFAGGAAVYFMRYPADVEVINDVNGELINLYRVVKNHLEEFVRQFKYALSSREVFRWLSDTRPETLTDIQRAARFFYLQQSAFGGKIEGRTYGTATTAPPGLNLRRLEEILSAAHLRLSSAYIEHLPWRACVERYDRAHTFFYMDPPYYQTEGYGVPFDLAEYVALADVMRRLKGRAILSLGDHPKMREIFGGFEMEECPIDYQVAGGDRRVTRTELIIYSWSRAAEPAGLF